MKGVIFYYSATGNTKLACEYIKRQCQNISFDLVNIKNKNQDLSSYDIVGFAATADFWGPPYLVKTFVEQLPIQDSKMAFVFNTYGLFSGKTLTILQDWVKAKGFKVVAGFSLRTPENYPPLIVKGITSKNAPKQKDLQKFNDFIKELDDLSSLPCKDLKEAKLKIGLISSLIPSRARTAAKYDMGEKLVDESLCTQCGICQNECPYGAVELNPKPVFNNNKCYGCWTCFNHCPTKAIYTRKIRGRGQYPGPLQALAEKLK